MGINVAHDFRGKDAFFIENASWALNLFREYEAHWGPTLRIIKKSNERDEVEARWRRVKRLANKQDRLQKQEEKERQQRRGWRPSMGIPMANGTHPASKLRSTWPKPNPAVREYISQASATNTSNTTHTNTTNTTTITHTTVTVSNVGPRHTFVNAYELANGIPLSTKADLPQLYNEESDDDWERQGC